MENKDLCTALVSILVGALLGSPFMVIWFRERERRKQANKRRRRGPPK